MEKGLYKADGSVLNKTGCSDLLKSSYMLKFFTTDIYIMYRSIAVKLLISLACGDRFSESTW